jgi:outer membrane immunogenic protein
LSNAASGAVLNSATSNFDLNGVIGGGQIGYNWQRNNWVFGLEADIQGSAQKGSTNAACPGGSLAAPPASLNSACSVGHIGDTAPFNVAALPVNESLSESLDWFGTVRGRLGPTITPTVFGYVTGGFAYGHVSVTNSVGGTNLVGPQNTNGVLVVPVGASFSNSTTKLGWTIGVGLEGVIRGNWTGKVEYLYVDLGTVSGSFLTPIVAPGGAGVVSSYSSHITDNILRVGINYQFH